MKVEIELERLIYPKKLFKKDEVIKERNKLKLKNLWKIESDKLNFYLILRQKI